MKMIKFEYVLFFIEWKYYCLKRKKQRCRMAVNIFDFIFSRLNENTFAKYYTTQSMGWKKIGTVTIM